MPANSLLRPSLLRDLALLLLVSYAAFWFNLGSLGLIDPDEPFYALTAREMVEGGDWLTPHIFGAPQFEKPIFYYWMAAGSFAVFGQTEFAGRFPTAVFATILVFLTYGFARRLFNPRVGLVAGLYMATGIELLVMGRLMLTDIPLTVFITGSLFCYWLALKEPEKRDRWMFWHMVCGGFAVLTKGPIGSIVPLLATIPFSIFAKQPFLLFRGRGFWLGAVAYAAIVVPWYSFMLIEHGYPFFYEFFVRDNWMRILYAEHPSNNHLWYYPGVLIFGSIPWMAGALMATRDLFQRVRDDHSQLFVKCWFLGNLVLLSAVASKLPSYGFYLFVPGALMIGVAIDRLLSVGFRSKAEKWTVIGAASVQALAAFIAPSVNEAKPFAITIYLFGGLLTLGLILLLMRQYRLWIGATVLAGIGFAASALTIDLARVESVASVRPIAKKMLALQREGEPLMGGKFAVRGIRFYTHQDVLVIANNEQPFWAEHHALTIIPGKGQLDELLEKTSSALITMRKPEWDKYHNGKAFRKSDPKVWFGQNLLIRADDHRSEKTKAKDRAEAAAEAAKAAAESKPKAQAAPVPVSVELVPAVSTPARPDGT